MSQRNTFMGLDQVLEASRESVQSKQAKQASAAPEDSYGDILDSVIGERKQASETLSRDEVVENLQDQAAKLAQINQNANLKEAALIGACIVDGMHMRAQQLEAGALKVASAPASDSEFEAWAKEAGFENAEQALKLAYDAQVALGEHAAEMVVEEAKMAAYNMGHYLTLQNKADL